ncbi:hypothetical protein QN386_22360 [Pseudomonas sp. CCI3.2]|uniref:hypothetical protein n=1 Tax=unclassified Pseudomonas TaxID=196821 RepID=UPI002B22D93D|nr:MULTISPECIES: hypothetical protein [unclassified Pseudomonas]MEB0078041.1 hypothetical protein [Pseudomonas sp. MH10out]MEB0104048.1 hypothetical protein [Pseudomonas sp. CCI3.2]
MPDEEKGTEMEELVEGEDLELLEVVAAHRGISVSQLAKSGIQKIFAERTRPRPMPGIIQAFGSRPRK